MRVFTWTAATPALPARYRLEWRFRARHELKRSAGDQVTEVLQASQRMREIGVVQYGSPVLVEVARPFDLPAERCVEQLCDAMEHIGQVDPFAKGIGLAAPQIGIGRAAAAVQPPGRDTPAIVADEQYEGCLSIFDVRGMVPRPLTITLETTALDGTTVTTVYERGLARLVAHEIDHLDGLLYTARMRPGVEPVPVEEYRQTGRAWAYDS